MNQKLIIVRGAACSGKTTICAELRDFDKKIAWLSIDKVKLLFSDSKEEAMDEVNESALVILENLLDRNYSVVVDGIFKKLEHVQEVIEIGKTRKIPVIIYQLKCSLQTLKDRDKNRNGVKQGLWKPLGDELIESLYRKVEENPIHGAIELDTEEKSLDECIEIIKKSLD